MERMTTKKEDGSSRKIKGSALAFGQDGYSGPAAEKLAALEDLCENIVAEQEELSVQLELLRSEDKTRTNRFRELMGKKLINSNVIGLLKLYGLL